jgi:hypothetical protein
VSNFKVDANSSKLLQKISKLMQIAKH